MNTHFHRCGCKGDGIDDPVEDKLSQKQVVMLLEKLYEALQPVLRGWKVEMLVSEEKPEAKS